jgi:hypothetical protein
VSEAASIIKSSLRTTQLSVILINLLLTGILNFFLMMINPMQLIIYLPLFNVPFPALTLKVFSVIVPIIIFDLLDEIDWR